MKKLITAAMMVLAVSNANAFYVQADCNFNLEQGRCEVYNGWNSPIYCRLDVAGQTVSGHWVRVWEEVQVFPGQSEHAYVYTNSAYYGLFTSVEGYASCQF